MTVFEPSKVSEYADGGNLLTLQKRRGRFTVDELMFYAAEIILGILALHEYNICHRFIAPETVLISATGHCKIGRLHKVMYKKAELQALYLTEIHRNKTPLDHEFARKGVLFRLDAISS